MKLKNCLEKGTTLELLVKLYKAKGYSESLEKIDNLLQDHDNFIKEYSTDVGVHIEDSEFNNRLEIAYNSTKKWIDLL